METYFSIEKSQYPPSLSDANGCLRHGMKSEIKLEMFTAVRDALVESMATLGVNVDF